MLQEAVAEVGGFLCAPPPLPPPPVCPTRLMGFRWSLGAEMTKIELLFLMSWEKSHLSQRGGGASPGQRTPLGLRGLLGRKWGAGEFGGLEPTSAPQQPPSLSFHEVPGTQHMCVCPPQAGRKIPKDGSGAEKVITPLCILRFAAA